MANEEQLAILKQGVEVWNLWKDKNFGKVVNLIDADLTNANLTGADLGYAFLLNAELSGANLTDANLINADLTNANLTGADLHNATLIEAKLSGANLTDANLIKSDFSKADLEQAKLTGAKLTEANLYRAMLYSADLTGADLTGASLLRAELTSAHLSGATLDNADLSFANLAFTVANNADLTSACLIRANLSNAILDGGTLTDSYFGATNLTSVDFSAVKGLESVRHSLPSSLGIDTLYKSKGQIPEVFLRGCGVPDSFIIQAKALIEAEDGIQFYSCFISYSGLDEEFARRLHGRLQQDHVRVWFAPHDIQGGKKLHEQIDEAIRVYDKLLILLSPNSLQSEWVMTELRKARKAERKTGKRKLFPVCLVNFQTLTDWECFDADGGKDLAVEVREYFIPDFSNWKNHDAFEAGFARLLKDLRADEKAKV